MVKRKGGRYILSKLKGSEQLSLDWKLKNDQNVESSHQK